MKKIFLECRWARKHLPEDWTILGFAKWVYDANFYYYKICFFGYELYFQRKFERKK